MEENTINENVQVNPKILKIFYIIQGILLLVGLAGLFAMVGVQIDSDLPEDAISVIGTFVSIICTALVAIGFFCSKDKLIGRTWFVWAILGFLLEILPVMLGRNAFSLVAAATFLVFRIILARAFLTVDKKKLGKIVRVLPVLLGLCVIVSSVYAGIIAAESPSYFKTETEAFFDGISENFLGNIFSYLITYLFAYLIILSKSGKLKFNNVKKLTMDKKNQTVNMPQQKELSATEKADVLKEYKNLLDEGIITAEEYEEKKNSILNAGK